MSSEWKPWAFVLSIVFAAIRLSTGVALSDEQGVREASEQNASAKTLQMIELSGGGHRFGFILKATAEEVEVLDIASNGKARLKRFEIRSMSSEKAEFYAVRRMGLPLVLSWKIKQYAKTRPSQGKIAKLEGPLVYVTLGSKSGVIVGDSLRVYRGEAEIRDPDTQEILGRERKLIGELSVTDVQASFSKARLSSEIDVEFKIGDQVEPKSQADAMVVLPFTTVSGHASASGAVLAEQLTTELTKREIPVVEAHSWRECSKNSRSNNRVCSTRQRSKDLVAWLGQ